MPPFGPAFTTLSTFTAAPELEDVERAAGGRSTPVPRSDRHAQARLPDGSAFIRVIPAPADGRARASYPMAAFVSPMPAGSGCQTLARLTPTLESEGWTAPPPFSIERHGGNGQTGPATFTRHDSRLRLYLFSDPAQGCVTRYALLWRMELAGLMLLAPSLAR